MKAAINTRYGPADVVEIAEVPAPQPGKGEIRVRVHASTLTRTDCGMRAPHPFFIRLAIGLVRPKLHILGLDFAGTVDAIGDGVTRLKKGDRVFGLSPDTFGAHAERLCMAENSPVAKIPSGTPFEGAVICEGAWYAEMYLRRFGLKPGHEILVYGASGAIGTAAVQLAKAYGARVTAVVGSRHMEMARSLGADQVIDYTSQDFRQLDTKFDFVFDAVGKISYFGCRGLLKPNGMFAATDLGPWGQNVLLSLWSTITRSNRVVFPLPKADKALIEFIASRIEAGALRGVFDRTYPLDDIVAAYRYVETQQKTGIVVIDIAQAG